MVRNARTLNTEQTPHDWTQFTRKGPDTRSQDVSSGQKTKWIKHLNLEKVISKQTRATQISNFQLRENFCTTTSPDQSTTQSSSALTQVHREERITVNRRDTNGDNRIVVNRIGEPPPLVGLQAPMESCYRIDFAFTTTPQWSTCSDVLVTQDFFMGHLKNAMINTELKI